MGLLQPVPVIFLGQVQEDPGRWIKAQKKDRMLMIPPPSGPQYTFLFTQSLPFSSFLFPVLICQHWGFFWDFSHAGVAWLHSMVATFHNICKACCVAGKQFQWCSWPIALSPEEVYFSSGKDEYGELNVIFVCFRRTGCQNYSGLRKGSKLM